MCVSLMVCRGYDSFRLSIVLDAVVVNIQHAAAVVTIHNSLVIVAL